MSKKEYFKRYLLFILGLYILSLGIALSTKANLGVSPVSSIPYVFSLALPFSLGQITIVVQLVYIACEIAILKRDFHPIQFLQIVIVIIYGYFNDFSLMIVSNVNPSNYALQWLLCFASMFVIAFGVNMEVRAGVMMLAVDGLMVTISQVFHIDFGKVKIVFDCSQVGIAVVFSFLLMHSLQGVREGTVAAAILVGLIIKLYNKKLAKFYEWTGLTPIQKASKTTDNTNTEQTAEPIHIITIAREVGSGGHEIGQILGKRMHLPVYDKDLIALTAQESGLSPELVEQKEQRMIYRFFQRLNDETYAPILEIQSNEDSIKNAQQAVVSRIAASESCIIVGRLGNYFLRNNPNCFHVFIHGEKNYRIRHFQAENNITFETATKEVERRDLERARHYKYYTGSDYGCYQNYHLSVDSSVYGSEKASEIIEKAAEIYFKSHQMTE